MADLRSEVLRAAEHGIKSVMPECFMKRIRVEDSFLILRDSLRIDLREFDEIVVLGGWQGVGQDGGDAGAPHL
jgi:hypothetical protein